VSAEEPESSQVSKSEQQSETHQEPESSEQSANPAPDTADSTPLYTVKDGNKVDEKTLMGWKTWRALACDRCHGPEQEGLVGPPLVESMKHLTKEEFHTTMMQGRPDKGMPPFNTSDMVMKNWEGLYTYLKGRADGQIAPGRLSSLDQP
jgi:mono/diheme cytochrome c family protein